MTDDINETDGGVVSGGPLVWLRVEGAAVLALATAGYAVSGQPWWLYAVLFLAPDLAMLAYLAGPRVGGAVYNVLHNYAGPILLAGVLYATKVPFGVPLIWAAHIGFDRMLGYGLKYPRGFAYTHLGRAGRGEKKAATR